MTTVIIKSKMNIAMNAIYTIASSAVTALVFTAGWSIAVGRRLQTIDDLKAGFGRVEADIKRLEDKIDRGNAQLIDRIAKLEGKVESMISKRP